MEETRSSGGFCYRLFQAAIFAYFNIKTHLWYDVWQFCKASLDIDCRSPENLRYEANVTGLQVIAASYGQTGTTTMMDALRMLGYRSYHADDYSIFAKPVMFDKIDPGLWARTVSRCRMEAISLEPVTDLLPLALSVSPQAKVILNWRDFASWIRSTTTGGQVKDVRFGHLIHVVQHSRTVFPYFELWDLLTGAFKRRRLAGYPMRQPMDMVGYLYRLVCNGYAWPTNDVYTRGTYKAHGQEEAYLAHIDEIRRVTPPGRLLEFDVKKHSWREIEKFMGLAPTMGNQKLPQTRSKHSRTNDPFFDFYPHVAFPAIFLLISLHAVNYFLIVHVILAFPFWCLSQCFAQKQACGAPAAERSAVETAAAAPEAAAAPAAAAPAASAAPAAAAPAAAIPAAAAPAAVERRPTEAPAAPAKPAAPAAAPAAAAAPAVEARRPAEAVACYEQALKACPIVAILRGVVPEEALDVGKALVEAGVTIVEVPLNSPSALESIRILAQGLPAHVVVGAGTVLSEEQVVRVAEAGGTIVVSPNMDERVIRKTRALGMVSLPGVATPTEAFAALRHGASGLKAFPGEQLPPRVLKAWRAVLPKGTTLLAVGGVSPDNLQEYWSAGVDGFGVGSALFRPGDSAATVRKRAEVFVRACRTSRP